MVHDVQILEGKIIDQEHRGGGQGGQLTGQKQLPAEMPGQEPHRDVLHPEDRDKMSDRGGLLECSRRLIRNSHKTSEQN